MNWNNSTFEVTDGLLMADKDDLLVIHNARVTVSRLTDPAPIPPPQVSVPPVAVRKPFMQRFADNACTTFLIGTALYLVAELIHAFSSGAVERLVR